MNWGTGCDLQGLHDTMSVFCVTLSKHVGGCWSVLEHVPVIEYAQGGARVRSRIRTGVLLSLHCGGSGWHVVVDVVVAGLLVVIVVLI